LFENGSVQVLNGKCLQSYVVLNSCQFQIYKKRVKKIHGCLPTELVIKTERFVNGSDGMSILHWQK